MRNCLCFMLAASVMASAWAVEYSEVTNRINYATRPHKNTECHESYAYHMTDANKDLPRLLLIGDQHGCYSYQAGVVTRLEGKMNVSFWTSSYCVTSPQYLKFLWIYLNETKYDVIQVSNGNMALCKDIPYETTNADWEKGLRAAFDLIREMQPRAKIIWANTTNDANVPVAGGADDDAKNKVKDLNDIAERVAGEYGIAVNNLYDYDMATTEGRNQIIEKVSTMCYGAYDNGHKVILMGK